MSALPCTPTAGSIANSTSVRHRSPRSPIPLIELAEAGHPVVAGTADLQYSNGLAGFARRFPERFTQFGISEQNMVSAAAGMATTGVMPYVATFASFLALLCCEQIRMDVAYCAQPVRLIGHHNGISLGFYGTSHHATEDIAIMRSIADLTVVSTADGPQFAAALRASVLIHSRSISASLAATIRSSTPTTYRSSSAKRSSMASATTSPSLPAAWPSIRPNRRWRR